MAPWKFESGLSLPKKPIVAGSDLLVILKALIFFDS